MVNRTRRHALYQWQRASAWNYWKKAIQGQQSTQQNGLFPFSKVREFIHTTYTYILNFFLQRLTEVCLFILEWSAQKVPPLARLEDMTVLQLNHSLREFYTEVRKKTRNE